MPILAPSLTIEPPIEKGAAAASQTRSATLQGVVGVGEIVEHDDELVAAEPGEHVMPSYLVAEPLGDALEDGVAGFVAELVVHLLEAVEIEEQDGELRARAPHPLECCFDAREEVGPVCESRELVVRRLARQLARPGLEVGERRHVLPGAGGQRCEQLDRLECARFGRELARPTRRA